jgi:hypothetical protein
MKKFFVWCIGISLSVFIVATLGGSFYMLDYSLSPRPNRSDTAACFSKLFTNYPETRPWVDSLRRCHALRDTFMTMPSGERHHARYIWNGSKKTALVLHGWRNSSVDILFIARIYDCEIGGYNVVIPDFHAHGLSEGDMIQMGWLDRNDMLQWLTAFQTDTMVVHGISMGGATTMMMSSAALPKGIKDIRFIDDCGYTSVWDEFAGELKNQFGLPEFPLMYTTSLLCKLRYGWSFKEASAIGEVSRSPHPMLFIHGSNDTFVPTEMVYRLYAAKPSKKTLWIAPEATHGQAYKMHKSEYVERVQSSIGLPRYARRGHGSPAYACPPRD